MSEAITCRYCWHPEHKANCLRDSEIPGVPCRCDNKTQWFLCYAPSEDEGDILASKISQAGYELHAFGGLDFVMEESEGRWGLLCFSRTLEPVASREEFEARVGITNSLLTPTLG